MADPCYRFLDHKLLPTVVQIQRVYFCVVVNKGQHKQAQDQNPLKKRDGRNFKNSTFCVIKN
jgi:hypothetical protein